MSVSLCIQAERDIEEYIQEEKQLFFQKNPILKIPL
jgi:hypothetical protein